MYFLTINAINLPVSILVGIVSTVKWMPLSFCSFGLAIGLLGYSTFFEKQYYFYHNLGYTRRRLAAMVFAFNAILAVPVLLIIYIL